MMSEKTEQTQIELKLLHLKLLQEDLHNFSKLGGEVKAFNITVAGQQSAVIVLDGAVWVDTEAGRELTLLDDEDEDEEESEAGGNDE